MLERIILAKPRGYCAGVEVAVDTVKRVAEAFPGEPIYMIHEIVHNEHVVRDLTENYNAIFVEDISKVPDGARVVLSAHGSPESVYLEARKRNMRVNDATCDLVSKVHTKARKYFGLGYEVVLIGHGGHQEVRGTMGQVQGIHLVQTPLDVERLSIPREAKVAGITQTTLSSYDVEPIVKALKTDFPNFVMPQDDICYATTNRQEAVMAMAKMVDLFLIIGSKNSSNSQRLVETAAINNVDAYLISTFRDIKPVWLEAVRNLGVTSGASTPEHLAEETVSHLERNYGGIVETFTYKEERVKFKDKVIV